MPNYTGLEYMATGGNQPPVAVATQQTGGNLPAQQIPMMTTGGNNPAYALNDAIVPPNTAPVPTNPTTSLEQFSPYNVVNDLVNQFSNNQGSFVQNARQRGLEQASRRGVLNSSIAGGNAERAALESIQPFVSEGVGLLNAREGRALQKNMQQDNAVLQDWMNSNQFNREFNGTLAMLPITNTYQLMQNIMQYGLDNPEVYTPDVISGTSNFFTRNMFDVLSQYFPGMVSTAGGTP